MITLSPSPIDPTLILLVGIVFLIIIKIKVIWGDSKL